MVKLVQLAPFPEEQVQFYVRTALFSGELIQATGDLYYKVNSGAVTSLILRDEVVRGWCVDKSDIPSLGPATFVTWTFNKWPYARAKGDQWTANAVFYRRYGDCFYGLTHFNSRWPSLIKNIDKVRVTITNSEGNYAQYFRVEYRVLNCKYFPTAVIWAWAV